MKKLKTIQKAYINAKTDKGKISVFNDAQANLSKNDLRIFNRWTLYTDVANTVYKFPTQNKEGFNSNEIEDIFKKYTGINKDKFNDALIGVTCHVTSDGNTIIYHCDIEKAILCGIENRDLYVYEWD